MSSVRRLDRQKLRARWIIAAGTLAVVLAFLLLRDTSARVSATPPAAGSSNEEVPSEQMSASGMPRPVRPQEE